MSGREPHDLVSSRCHGPGGVREEHRPTAKYCSNHPKGRVTVIRARQGYRDLSNVRFLLVNHISDVELSMLVDDGAADPQFIATTDSAFARFDRDACFDRERIG